MAADLIGLGICFENDIGWVEILLILLFVGFFEFSLGPIAWIYMSEVMTDKGTSIGTLVNLLLTMAMGLSVPFLIDAIGGYLFIIFGCFCVGVSHLLLVY